MGAIRSAIASLLLASAPACAQEWSRTDQALAAVIVASRAIDYGQTRWIMSDAGRAAGYREANPAIRQPWNVLLGGVLAIGLAHAYPAHRTVILGAAATVSVLIVGRNALLGVRVEF